MELTYAQKRQIYEQGFTVLRDAIPRVMVDRALCAINHSVGEGIPKEEIQFIRARSYCKELTNQPVVTDLINKTPVFELAESALGKGNLKSVGGGQIALRFPKPNDGPPGKLGGHLDGIPTDTNGVARDGKFHNFTMLAVVILSELDGPYAGNFTIWPGTHHKTEAFFREHGPESLLRDGMPKIDMPEPYQTTGKPGDVVLTHYSLVHTAAPNYSPHVRYATIYRLQHTRRTEAGYGDVMTDIWLEWDGIREVITEKREAAPVPAYA